MANFYGQRLGGIAVDQVIKKYFPQEYGVAIDCGAVDGIEINNTKHFEELGWSVLCIEANPRFYDALKRNRKNVITCAISDKKEENVVFHSVHIREANVYSAISGLDIDEKLIEHHNKMGYNCDITDVTVSTRTLEDCLVEFNPDHIDFISIDIEGAEMKALQGMDILKWNPKMFIIENNWNEPEIENYLVNFGYKKIERIEVNDFYLKQ